MSWETCVHLGWGHFDKVSSKFLNSFLSAEFGANWGKLKMFKKDDGDLETEKSELSHLRT